MQEPPSKNSSITRAFEALYELVWYLRGENGCPWDKAQGLESIMDCINEEVGELKEALEEDNSAGMSEEFGDAFFTFLMFGAIAEESKRFNIEQAFRGIEAKMIRRHPHIFGSSSLNEAEEVLAQWKQIKVREKQAKSGSESLMDSLPHFYSALKRADYVQKKAAEVGFDWPNTKGILQKIEEEISELRQALEHKNEAEISDEIGDLLFSCVNLSRFLQKDAESLLNKTTGKFIERFKYIEEELQKAGKKPADASLEEMDALWEKAKKQSRSKQ
jgi:tetrapyrrole methylase family protein/MazG family protein